MRIHALGVEPAFRLFGKRASKTVGPAVVPTA
jgi:hypothetical protein